jgi:hypothetical protein
MNWQYTKRSDGLIAITLDNNVWDFLFERKIDLAAELPSDEFAIFITREVEIESMAIPPDTEARTMPGPSGRRLSPSALALGWRRVLRE